MKTFSRIAKPLLIVFVLLISVSANAQKEKLQTAFIYQLTRLVEWCPEGKEGAFVIGIVGYEPTLFAELQTLQYRKVGGQPVEVKLYPTLSDIGKSNILFVPDSEFDKIDQIASKATGACSLIVSDRYGAARRGVGAGVTLYYNTSMGKIEFEINKKYMKDKSLSVNDQLYSLATNVY